MKLEIDKDGKATLIKAFDLYYYHGIFLWVAWGSLGLL
jgi:hypothetical protein